MNSEHTNAVAGPSTLSSTPPPSTMPHSSSSTPHSSGVPPLLFLPPPAPPPPRQHLASTQDLLSRFHLLPAYNKYVRTSLLPGADPSNDGPPPSTPGPSAMPGTLGKGKSKEDDDVSGGKGEKKNTYKHLIKSIPGKHSLKKDDSLTKVILEPPKQKMRIAHFDLRTQEEAFTVSLEGLKGWNINTLVLESAQAREDRKKRKELKRLAKLQAQQGGPLPQASTPLQQQQQQPHPPSIPSGPASAASQPQPIHAPIPTSATSSSALSSRRPSTSAPQRDGTPKLGTSTPRTASTTATNGTSVGTTRPGSTVPRPGSTLPNKTMMHPGQGQVPVKPQQQQAEVPTAIMRAGTPMNVDQVQQRGIKREREDGNVVGMKGVVNGVASNTGVLPTGLAAPPPQILTTNGYVNGNGVGPPKPNVNARAGTAGVRPRPIKKQKTDVTAPVQQPTPQGV